MSRLDSQRKFLRASYGDIEIAKQAAVAFNKIAVRMLSEFDCRPPKAGLHGCRHSKCQVWRVVYMDVRALCLLGMEGRDA